MRKEAQIIRERFSVTLLKALVDRYKAPPSAAFVAREFNLRAIDSRTITQETARRWIKGLSLPELEKILILQDWLFVDLNPVIKDSIPSQADDESKKVQDAIKKKDKFILGINSIALALETLLKEIKLLQNKADEI